jgi:catechol 2,3-dioxygenase-like lactoylglutathione lyase family enzyme
MLLQKISLHTAAPIAEMQVFYTETLGFRLLSATNEDFEVQMGDSTLHFHTTHLVNKQPFYHFACNIPTNKVEEAAKWLALRNIDCLEIPKTEADDEATVIATFEDWNARAIYFIDPAGNIVEFIARLDSRYTSLKPFAADSVISISEIGLACANAKTYAAELRTKYDLTSFQKSTNNEAFWALGADNGLFIISSENRNWFPTDTQVQHFPMKVLFKNRKNIDCELEVF